MLNSTNLSVFHAANAVNTLCPYTPPPPPPPPPPPIRAHAHARARKRIQSAPPRTSVNRLYNYGLSLLYTAAVWLILPVAAIAQEAENSPETAVGTAEAAPDPDGTAAKEPTDRPAIAVYVAGDSIPKTTKDALSTFLLDALVNSGDYRAIERSESVLAEIDREHAKQRDGSVDDAQISLIGKQAGVRFVCVATITPTLGSYQVSARVIDVETAAVAASGVSASPLESLTDLKQVSAAVVYKMLGVRMKTEENFELLTANEKTALEHSIQQTVQETMRAKQPWRKSFWVALSADVAGAGVLGIGLYKEMNVRDLIGKGRYSESKRAETARDVCYVAGTVILLSGISIHIFF